MPALRGGRGALRRRGDLGASRCAPRSRPSGPPFAASSPGGPLRAARRRRRARGRAWWWCSTSAPRWRCACAKVRRWRTSRARPFFLLPPGPGGADSARWSGARSCTRGGCTSSCAPRRWRTSLHAAGRRRRASCTWLEAPPERGARLRVAGARCSACRCRSCSQVVAGAGRLLSRCPVPGGVDRRAPARTRRRLWPMYSRSGAARASRRRWSRWSSSPSWPGSSVGLCASRVLGVEHGFAAAGEPGRVADRRTDAWCSRRDCSLRLLRSCRT